MSDKEEIKVEPKEGEGESSEKRLFSTQDISDIQKKLEEEVDKDMKEKEDSPLETEAVQEEASGEETAEAFEDKIESRIVAMSFCEPRS